MDVTLEPIEIAANDNLVSWAQIRSIGRKDSNPNLDYPSTLSNWAFQNMEIIIKQISNSVDNGPVAGFHDEKLSVGWQTQNQNHRLSGFLNRKNELMIVGEFNAQRGNKYLTGSAKLSSNKEKNHAVVNIGLTKKFKTLQFKTRAGIGTVGGYTNPEIAITGNVAKNIWLNTKQIQFFTEVGARYKENSGVLNVHTEFGAKHLIHQSRYTLINGQEITVHATIKAGITCDGTPQDALQDCNTYADLRFKFKKDF